MPGGASDIKAGRAYVELLLKDSAFTKGIRNAGKQLKDFGKGVGILGAAVGAGAAAFTAPIIEAVKHFADFGSELNDASIRTGIAASALAELGYAAEQSGSDMEGVEGAIRKMQKFLGSGKTASEATAKSLRGLGLTFKELQNLSPDQQFQAIADKISEIPNATQRAAAAMEIFGKKGTSLLPMLEDLAEMRQEARDLGIAPSDASVVAADNLGDAFHRIIRVAQAVAYEIGFAVAPAVQAMTGTVTRVLATVVRWVKGNSQLISTIAKVAAGAAVAGTVIAGLGAAIFGAGVVLTSLAGGLGAIGGILATVLSPIGIITAALIAGAYVWANYTDSGKDAIGSLMGFFSPLLDIVKSVFGGIRDAIMSGNLALAGQIAMLGLQTTLLQGVAALSSMVGGALGDFIGTLGADLASGDLAGAWSAIVAQMGDVWARFSEGIVGVFTQASRAIVTAWEGTANKILQISAGGGLLGKLASKVLGVDLEAEQKRLEAINAGLGKVGGNTGQGSVLDQAQAATADRANQFRANLDGIDRGAEARTAAARDKLTNRTAGGSNAAQGAADAAAAELAKLTGDAAALAEESRAQDEAKKSKVAGKAREPGELTNEVTGSFSAAALQAQGGNGTDAAIKGTYEELKELRKQSFEDGKELRKAISDSGGVFGA